MKRAVCLLFIFIKLHVLQSLNVNKQTGLKKEEEVQKKHTKTYKKKLYQCVKKGG